MKIEVIKNHKRGGKQWKKGELVHVTNEVAAKLIEQGKASNPSLPKEEEQEGKFVNKE